LVKEKFTKLLTTADKMSAFDIRIKLYLET